MIAVRACHGIAPVKYEPDDAQIDSGRTKARALPRTRPSFGPLDVLQQPTLSMRKVEVLRGQGMPMVDAVRYGGIGRDRLRLLKELQKEIFYTLKEARFILQSRRHHCDTARPHASLGRKSPAPEVFISAFAARSALQSQSASPPARTQRASTLHLNPPMGPVRTQKPLPSRAMRLGQSGESRLHILHLPGEFLRREDALLEEDVREGDAPDQRMILVDPDMHLVAEHALLALPAPARIQVGRRPARPLMSLLRLPRRPRR